MNKFFTLSVISLFFTLSLFAAKAPEFTLKNEKGEMVKLSDYKGKTVVLEWYNEGCPFVRKHYDAGNMQRLQAKYTKKGIVWLTIISSAKGKQGYLEDGALKDKLDPKKSEKMKSTHLLKDADGKVGQLYSAKTTPHMYIISKKGDLVYQGAIDSNDSAESKDIASSKNYVSTNLDLILTGKAIKVAKTKPYGCSVKY